MKKLILSLALVMSLSTMAISKYDVDVICESIERNARLYAVYGAVGLKSVLGVINSDTAVPAGLKAIIIDAYDKGSGIGPGLNASDKDDIARVTRVRCLAYFGYSTVL